MKLENLESDLALLYNRARDSFEKCIRNEGNKFLKDEVSIPLDDIVLVERDVRIVFSTEYVTEVTLSLFDGSTEIGKYVYVENDKKEGVDDSLVLY